MTLVTISRLFEKALIAKSTAAQELTPFIDFVNQGFDNVIRVLRKGIGVRDNLDAAVYTVKVTHAQQLKVAVTKRPFAVIIAQSKTAVTSYLWEQGTESTQILLTIKFDGVPTDAVDVVLWVQYS